MDALQSYYAPQPHITVFGVEYHRENALTISWTQQLAITVAPD